MTATSPSHIDNPPVNALNYAMRAVRRGAGAGPADAGTAAIVTVCAGRTFIAGADMASLPAGARANHST
jgi:3-hydroxyacyl-CoA dehydrogenase